MLQECMFTLQCGIEQVVQIVHTALVCEKSALQIILMALVCDFNTITVVRSHKSTPEA